MRRSFLVALLLVITGGCVSSTLRITSAGSRTTSDHSGRVAFEPLPNYSGVVVHGSECRQRFGSGPRYEEHPMCRVGMTAPLFTLEIPDLWPSIRRAPGTGP